MCRVIAVSNQKGGCAKTTTAYHLAVGLAMEGKRTLAIDNDPQGHLGRSFGIENPDDLKVSLADILTGIIQGDEVDDNEAIIHIADNIDFVPANTTYAGMELALCNAMSRERILKEYIDNKRDSYDYIIIDCNPTLGLFTINALTAADSVLIPVQAENFGVSGLTQLMQTISSVRKKLNPTLKIEGAVFTIVSSNTNDAKAVMEQVKEAYGKYIYFFEKYIPTTVKIKECSGSGVSMYEYKPKSKATLAYKSLVKEVMQHGK